MTQGKGIKSIFVKFYKKISDHTDIQKNQKKPTFREKKEKKVRSLLLGYEESKNLRMEENV